MSRLSMLVVLGSVLLGAAATANAQQIYWTESQSGEASIRRINADGTGLETIIIQATIQNPRGIAVDSDAGKIYWIDDAPGGTCTIRKANLDGSNVEDICGDVGVNPNDLILNIAEGKLYIMDDASDRILRVNLDGSNPEEPVPPAVPIGSLSSMYIVNPNGTVPAVSTWGFGIMLLLMLGIATLAFQRRANSAAGCEVDGVVGR